MTQRFMIKLTYGGTKKRAERFFGNWINRVDAEEVRARWQDRVASHFYGDVDFEVAELEPKDITIATLREDIRDAGMN